MKFEGIAFKKTGYEPPTMGEFFAHYALVCRFLQQFNENKLTLQENISNFASTVNLVHATEITVRHGLSYVPTMIIPLGRVEFIQLISADNNKVVIKARLHTADILEPTPGRPQNRMLISDSSFFTTQDSVRIGKDVRKIVGMYRGRLLLKGNVLYDESVTTVSLANENARLLII